MDVLIRAVFRGLCPVIAVYAFYLLLRGHNEPGGGFIGGLLLGLSGVLWVMANPNGRLTQWILCHVPEVLGGIFLFLIAVMLAPVFLGQSFFTAIWTDFWLPMAGKFSSVLLFDTAVFVVVCVVTLFAYASLASSPQDQSSRRGESP